MANGKETYGIALQPPPEHWPKLVGALLDDLTKIIEGEIRLFSASLEATFTNALARSLRQLVSVVLGLYAAFCLIGATILLLHNWFAWWKSLGITGITVLLGVILSAAITRYIDGHREPTSPRPVFFIAESNRRDKWQRGQAGENIPRKPQRLSKERFMR